MNRVLVFQHVPFEILGTLDPLLKSYGVRIKYVNFGRRPDARPRLDGYQGLVVLGGPMSVHDTERHPHLATELELIGRALERGLPVLGICLGAQLLAHALGARVTPSPEKEIGWYPVELTPEGRRDPMFAHFAPSERIFQWHGDAFELPDGAVHLAATPGCPYQAFRYGENAYGLQFHMEVDEALIERWLSVPAHVAELAELHGEIDPDAIRAETRRHIARLRTLADRSFAGFAERIGAERRRAAHPHAR